MDTDIYRLRMKIIKISAVILGIAALLYAGYYVKSRIGIDIIKSRHLLFFKEKVR